MLDRRTEHRMLCADTVNVRSVWIAGGDRTRVPKSSIEMPIPRARNCSKVAGAASRLSIRAVSVNSSSNHFDSNFVS